MTLSFIAKSNLTFPVCLDDTLLKTVCNEEEAFTEMRKYLEVNGIKSEYTTIRRIYVKDENNNVIDNAKAIDFHIGRTMFLIRYKSHPKFLTLQKSYFDACSSWLYDFRDGQCVSAYDELLHYFNASATEQGGDQ